MDGIPPAVAAVLRPVLPDLSAELVREIGVDPTETGASWRLRLVGPDGRPGAPAFLPAVPAVDRRRDEAPLARALQGLPGNPAAEVIVAAVLGDEPR